MRCIAQSELAWGEGDSAASRVMVAVCGAYPRASFNTEYRQMLEVVLEFISGQTSDITGRAVSRLQRATQSATERSPPSPRALFALFHTKRGERGGVRGKDHVLPPSYCSCS
jgi:hypothetical protein